MGLWNYPPSVVEAKAWCETAQWLKLIFFNIYFHSHQLKPKSYLKLMKKYIFSKGEQFPLIEGSALSFHWGPCLAKHGIGTSSILDDKHLSVLL